MNSFKKKKKKRYIESRVIDVVLLKSPDYGSTTTWPFEVHEFKSDKKRWLKMKPAIGKYPFNMTTDWEHVAQGVGNDGKVYYYPQYINLRGIQVTQPYSIEYWTENVPF